MVICTDYSLTGCRKYSECTIVNEQCTNKEKDNYKEKDTYIEEEDDPLFIKYWYVILIYWIIGVIITLAVFFTSGPCKIKPSTNSSKKQYGGYRNTDGEGLLFIIIAIVVPLLWPATLIYLLVMATSRWYEGTGFIIGWCTD